VVPNTNPGGKLFLLKSTVEFGPHWAFDLGNIVNVRAVTATKNKEVLIFGICNLICCGEAGLTSNATNP